jgi:hypothetical protein
MPASFHQPMEDIKEKAGGLKEKTQNLTDHVSDLLESYYKLGILNVTEKGTEIASLTITLFVVSFLLLCALLFIGFGVAWWLGEKLNSMLSGFMIVACFFILVVAIIMALRKQLLFPLIRNIIIKKVYE